MSQDETPDVSVVLPTYEESAALPVIVPRIVAALAEAQLTCEVIVVDDDSPDGTAEVAEQLAQRYPVRVHKRKGVRGLATAVLEGFDLARAPICVVMDADGSHPVSALPEMVRMVRDDRADLVVGSRHLPGGGSRNWPLFSRFKSQVAAALTLGLTSMTDPTTGLLAIRKPLLAGRALDPVGWKVVLELVVKTAPARLAELPIVFEDRELGQSKQSLRVFLQYLAHVGKLYGYRYPGLSEFVKFCLVGLLGLAVDLSVVTLVKESWGLDTRLCAVLGFSAAVSSNYWLNRRFTFAHGTELPAFFSYLTYVGTNLFGLAVRVVTVHAFMLLAQLDTGRSYLVSNAAGIALATLFNFVGAKYFAFAPERLEFGSSAAARSEYPEAPLSRRMAIGAATLLLASAMYAAVTSTADRELTTIDERVNVTMAENMQRSIGRVLRPSVYSVAREDWVKEDLPALGNTPFFPGLLAIAGAGPLSRSGMGLVPLLALWVTVACSALLWRPLSRRAALYTALLLASSPALVHYALMLEFEPVLTAFCAAGLYFAVRGASTRRPLTCAVGGALLGFGFLTKLWLTVPYAFAACALVLVQTTLVRAREREPLWLRRSVIAGLLGFLPTAGLHLALTALFEPQDLGRWLNQVYLAIFTGHGVTGDKLSAIRDYAAQPPWYYPAVLYRDHFYLLPLALFGLPALLRRVRPLAVLALAMAFAAGLGVIVLSVPAVKEPLFVLAAVPFLYMLAGVSLSELEGDSPKYRAANRAAVFAGCGVAALSLAAVWLTYLAGKSYVDARYAFWHSAGMLAVAGIGAGFLRGKGIALPLLCASAMGLGALVLGAP